MHNFVYANAEILLEKEPKMPNFVVKIITVLRFTKSNFIKEVDAHANVIWGSVDALVKHMCMRIKVPTTDIAVPKNADPNPE